MSTLLERIEVIGAALLDPWLVVDTERRVVAYNRHFRALFDRAAARHLTGSQCCAHLELAPCASGGECLALRALAEDTPLRLDEIEATLIEPGERRTLIVSANGLHDPETGEGPYALMVLRDVSDLADVQRKYRSVVDAEAGGRAALEQALQERTLALKATHQALNASQEELLRLRRSLLG